MRRLLLTAAAVAALTGCSLLHDRKTENPYQKPPFYMQFLDQARPLDRQIARTVDALRATPRSVDLHNRLGQMLMQKGFPKDAAREFERAINIDRHFYPAWYNLGLVRASQGDDLRARRAFNRTVSLQKGHAEALFQLGLMAEKAGDAEGAIWYYASAFEHNRSLLDVRVNPRILDSKLIHLALLKNYDVLHAGESADFKPSPGGYAQPHELEAPSKQAAPQDIVTPAPPVTSPAMQAPPPAPDAPPPTPVPPPPATTSSTAPAPAPPAAVAPRPPAAKTPPPAPPTPPATVGYPGPGRTTT